MLNHILSCQHAFSWHPVCMPINLRARISHIAFIMLFLCLTLLTACSTVRKDGPPRYDIDVSHIPDAKPKVEALSRIGNKPYVVFGKRYYVMNSSKNYKERGIASWYGTKFHARHTSSGERYNMLAMTAAHRSLPLPTYVQVKNLHNGRKIIVKVNDRGPFESGRLIDLSYAAAKKLGMVGHGTTRVEVTAIDPRAYHRESTHAPVFLAKNTKHHTPPATHQAKQTVYLQVGAFSNRTYAEKLQKRIQSVIHSPVHITKLQKSKILYCVRIGPIYDQASVSKINQQLNSLGLYKWVSIIKQQLNPLDLNNNVVA